MLACCLRKKRCIKGKLSFKSKKRDSLPFGNFAPKEDGDEGKIVFFGGSNDTFDLDDLLAASAQVLGKSAFATTYKVALDWESRLRIAIGAVRGLAIIHEADEGRFVHGNIKASNIFVNSQCYGCICDLGLTGIMRSLPQTTLRSSGYHAPETTDTRKCTQFSDVYSFGVVLLELLTGKSPVSPQSQEGNMDLASWIRSVVSKEWTSEVFDDELMRQMDIEDEMVEMLQIGLACVALKPQDRPHIANVMKMIQEIRTL